MKARIWSTLVALALVATSVMVIAGTTVNHRVIDRTTTSIGLTSNPDSLGTTQEVTLVQRIPGIIDGNFKIVATAGDSVKVLIEATAKAPSGADSVWVTAYVDTAAAGVTEAFTIPAQFRSFYAYRITLDDVETGATRIRLFEEFDYTRGGRGW